MNNHTGKVYGEATNNTESREEEEALSNDLASSNAKVIIEEGSNDYNYTSIVQRKYYKDTSLKTFTIGDDIQNIGRLAFARSGLKSIDIPDSVVSIEYGAFYSCTSLSNITIGDGITYIGTRVFEGTPWLTRWQNGEWGDSDFLIIGDGILLSYRGSDEKVEVPDEVKQIGPEAFVNNENITSVYLPESVTKICTDAFKNCSSLDTVSGCKGLKEIVHGAFNGTAIENVDSY